MLGAIKRFLPDEGLVNAAVRGGSSVARKDIEGLTTLLIDAEMRMFDGLRTPVIFLQNVVVDLLLGLGMGEPFRIFADHVRSRYDAEPGFITMNLPALVGQLDQTVLRNGGFRAVAMSVFASGAIPAAEAIEWVCEQPNIEAIVFGASSRANIRNTRELVSEHWGGRPKEVSAVHPSSNGHPAGEPLRKPSAAAAG
jgi:hypothetical protein